jgi:hypothetical protein
MRLKNYVFFRETDKGVWFDAGRRSFALNGKGIYPLVERLLNALEKSGRDPDELSAGLPETVRPFARRLFGELARHGMLQRDIAGMDDAGSSRHAAHSEFLKYLQDNAADDSLGDKLSGWRRATIAVVGDGYAAKAAAGVLVDSGCGRVLLHCASTTEVGRDEFELALGDRSDSEFVVSEDDFDPSAAAGPVAGLVLASGGGLAIERAIGLAGRGRQAGMTVCAALPVNGHLLAMAMDADDMPGIADLADWLLPPADVVTFSPENLAIAGSIAAQEMIARFFGILGARRGGARIVSPYSEVSECLIPASPRHHAHDAIVRPPDMTGRIEMPEERVLSQYELLRMALTPWLDPALSVLTLDLPEALPQLPLYHEAFAVRQPGRSRDDVQIAVGWGLNPEEAGLRASMNAIAVLAEQEFGSQQGLVAGMDDDAWRSGAFARAFVHHASFDRDAEWGTFGADDIDDPETRVLLRILDFQVAAPVRFRVGFVPGFPAVVVACDAGDECVSRVCGASFPTAIREAVGLAISRIQLRSIARLVRPDEIALAIGSGLVRPMKPDAIARAIEGAAVPAAARFLRSRRLGLPESVACGYAAIGEAA